MGKTVDGEVSKSVKPLRKKFDEALTKVIIRRLPPALPEENFLSKLNDIFPDGIPPYDYFRFCGSDQSFSPISFCRAYINFRNAKDILKFKEKLDGYVFDDSKGGQYPVVVEFAPFQGVPKKTRRRKDTKSGTIEKDSDYLSFLESLQQEVEPLPSAEVYLEQQEANKQNTKDAKLTTPLIEYIKMKKTSGKSRMSSQRSAALSANEKKRKSGKDSGKGGNKNSFSEKRAQNENFKKAGDKKVDEARGGRKFCKEEGEKKRPGWSSGEKKSSERSQEWKGKEGAKEEKEKTTKGRPNSAKSWKESRSRNDYPNSRPGSSMNRPPSSYRTPRKDRVSREPNGGRGGENVDRSERPAGKNDERAPNKFQAESKEGRVRNKDRPAQAIYQPRSRPARPEPDDSTKARPGTREQKEKQPGKGFRDGPSRDRDGSSRDRDGPSRDREGRDNGRRPSRDGQKSRSKANDATTTKE